MNIQIVRQRFSTFLKQFRIEDLKLLMQFLEIIVSEYKNSRASRLFDLLSETSNIDIDEYDLTSNSPCIDRDSCLESSAKKLKLNRDRANFKTQSEKYRRMKLIVARKRSANIVPNVNSTHFNHTNGNTVDTNDTEDVSNTDVKKSLSPAMEDDSLQANSSVEAKDLTDHSETNVEEAEQEHQEQGEADDLEADKYAANRSQIRMMDSNRKKSFRPQIQLYHEQSANSYSENTKNNLSSNIGLNNEHSNQSLAYFDEESIDRMFETNSADEYIENDAETAMSTYGAQKNMNSRWMLKQNTLPLDSSILMSSISGSIVKGVTKCAVCNDTASGTRYGVCVCEGCKEFFRRQRENSGHRSLYCVNGTNSCPINMNNRTQCRKCRLDKCLKLGMKLVGK